MGMQQPAEEALKAAVAETVSVAQAVPAAHQQAVLREEQQVLQQPGRQRAHQQMGQVRMK